jgi:1,4-alpha-glucan branching enzyme
VTLFGAWMPVGSEEPMTKDADGVWTITVGPLAPNGQLYTFNIDGVTAADLRRRGRWRMSRTAAWR